MDAELARRRGADESGGGTETAQSLAGAYGIARYVHDNRIDQCSDISNGGKAAVDASKAKEAVSASRSGDARLTYAQVATDFFGRKIVKSASAVVAADSVSLDVNDVFTGRSQNARMKVLNVQRPSHPSRSSAPCTSFMRGLRARFGRTSRCLL